MFKSKKKLIEIENKLKQIEQEKQELLKIKEVLEDVSPKIDIKDLYVFSIDNTNYIVKLQVDKCQGANMFGCKVIGNESKLYDVFSNKLIYKKFSYNLVNRKEYIGDRKQEFYFYDDYAYLKPIIEVDKDLLAFPNLLVPEYVLMNLYYKLNNVNINSPILTRKKTN